MNWFNWKILLGSLVFVFSTTSQAQIVGHIGSVQYNGDGVQMLGWVCAKGVHHSINAHIYVGGAAGQGGSFLAGFRADKPSEPAVGNACGSSHTAFRFDHTLSADQVQPHAGKKVYIHGIHPQGPNLTISRSGHFSIPTVALTNDSWQWQDGTVASVACHDGPTCFIQLNQHNFDKQNCRNNLVFFDSSTPGGRSMLSMANSAYLSKSPVQLHVYQDTCHGSGLKLHRIKFQRN